MPTDGVSSSLPDSGAPASQGGSTRCPHCSQPRYFRGERGLKIHIGRCHKPGSHAPPTTNPASSSPSPNFWEDLCGKKTSVPVVKRIPRGARNTVASALSSHIREVVNKNDRSSWERLLTFPYYALHVERGKEVGGSLTQKIKNNCVSGSCSLQNFNNRTFTVNKNKKPESNTKKIESKLNDGDTKGAADLLFSSDALAPDTEDTYSALLSKHPPPAATSQLPDAPDGSECTPVVTSDEVLAAVLSFKNGSAGGLDSLSPQHLKDLLCYTQSL